MRRQSVGAIAVAVVKYFEMVVRQALWPLIILYFFGQGADSFTRIVIYISLFAGLFSIVAAVLRYLYFYFSVQSRQLVVKSGVLTTKNLSIPFEKIQRVEFEQNFVHRILDIVTVRVETAGAEEEEVEISALSRSEAEELREMLLSAKKQIAAEDEDSAPIDKAKEVFRLRLGDLLLAGLLRNHLRTFGIVMAFFVGMYFQFEEVLDLESIFVEWMPAWYYSDRQWSGLIMFFPVILVVVVGISLIRTVLQYFEFKMWRKANGYQVMYGLFNRRTYSSLDKKVQYIYWQDNLLMRLLKMFSVSIFQAGSMALRSRQAIQVPFCYSPQIDMIRQDIFSDFVQPENTFQTQNPYIRLLLFRYGVIPILIFGSLIYVNTSLLIFSAVIMTWLLLTALWAVRYTQSMKLIVNDRFLEIHRGVFSRKTWVMEYPKLQGTSIKSNPFEERRGLKTLVFHSAAGTVQFPYMKREDAVHLSNLILYRVELLREDWM